jgi:hypothetical protein
MTKSKKKTTDIIIWSTVSLAVLAVGFLAYKKFFKKKKPKSKFKQKLIDVTNAEWKDWDKGQKNERSSSMYQRLKEYWNNINWGEDKWSPSGTAWSAAFISYVMKKAGAGDDFKYSSSHSKYIRDAVKNRKENNSNPFKAYKLSEKQAVPEVGDLVCYSRESKTDLYDRTSSYKSHCDIVVSKTADTIDVIGGNVNHTVGKKTVPLNLDGTVKKGSVGKKWFTVIKNFK